MRDGSLGWIPWLRQRWLLPSTECSKGTFLILNGSEVLVNTKSIMERVGVSILQRMVQKLLFF
jgi:hypothetical protein